jgi:hypothetical protein
LQGGNLPLGIVVQIFENQDRFARSISAMLDSGEVGLLVLGVEVPRWNWRLVLSSPGQWDALEARLRLNDAGARRIG